MMRKLKELKEIIEDLKSNKGGMITLEKLDSIKEVVEIVDFELDNVMAHWNKKTLQEWQDIKMLLGIKNG